METTSGLTDLAVVGGCAAKYPARLLEELVAGLVPADSENLLVGLTPADDAAVYRLDDERALIFTVDFFPPLVDDPADFGAIAAVNALNDVFAMGGAPLLALSVAAFPEDLARETVAAILSAADAKVREAGALLAGGHTIRDTEPKYGLAVVGTASPEGIWRNSTARPGDALFLTKPLGTGLVLTGVKEGLLGAGGPDDRCRADAGSQRGRGRGAAAAGPHAVTDVTGFGLFGHAVEVAERSGVRAGDRGGAATGAARRSARPRARGSGRAAIPRNRDFTAGRLSSEGIPPELDLLGFDPQTAGGLLVSLPQEQGAVLEADFRRARPLDREDRPGRGRQRGGRDLMEAGTDQEPAAAVVAPRSPPARLASGLPRLLLGGARGDRVRHHHRRDGAPHGLRAGLCELAALRRHVPAAQELQLDRRVLESRRRGRRGRRDDRRRPRRIQGARASRGACSSARSPCPSASSPRGSWAGSPCSPSCTR